MNSDFQHRRVVIYARVSTEHEAQLSALENQIDWYKPILAARPEWELVGQYVDEGITGTSAEKRPQFMQMIADAMQRKFDLIITREVARFARNTVDTLQYTRKLKEKGVEVFFINDNIKTMDGDGELRLTLMATFAQDESRKTSIRVKSGQQTSMENGVVYGSGNILGYDRVGKGMVINPEQAKVVRMIFDWYLNGWGLTKIKNELELRHIPTATGLQHWHVTVISHILQNSFYCGIMTYHKEYTPDYLKQKKIPNRGVIPKLQVRGTHEPIITEEEYERVQMIMESKRRDLPGHGGRKNGKLPITTVWGRLLICSCGHKFNRKGWSRTDRKTTAAYQCYSSLHTGTYESRKKKGLSLDGICQSPTVPEWKLQMMANLIFREYLWDRDKVLNLANSILEAHFSGEKKPEVDEQALREKHSELERLHRKCDTLIEMRAEGDLTREAFKQKKAQAESEILRLESEIHEMETVLCADPEPVKDYTEKLEVLRYALEQYTTPDEEDVPPSVIEAFVEKIVVSKDGYDWYLRFSGDPNDPLHCTTEGKRRSTTTITVSNGQTSITAPARHRPRLRTEPDRKIQSHNRNSLCPCRGSFLRVEIWQFSAFTRLLWRRADGILFLSPEETERE